MKNLYYIGQEVDGKIIKSLTTNASRTEYVLFFTDGSYKIIMKK
jgi:hypothetical protein